jgi:hypothetical protein
MMRTSIEFAAAENSRPVQEKTLMGAVCCACCERNIFSLQRNYFCEVHIERTSTKNFQRYELDYCNEVNLE